MADKIRVNGNSLSWGSIVVTCDGDKYFGFTGISYGDKRERTKQYGMGKSQRPRGRSRGKYTVDNAKLTGPKASVHDLRAALAAKAADGVSYGDVVFQVVSQYVEDDETPQTVELVDCVWAASSSDEKEGGDPTEETFELDVMAIKRNGLTLYDSSEDNG